MAAIFLGVGAATALSPSNCFDSKKLLLSSSRRSLSGKKAFCFVVRSDGSEKLNSNQRCQRTQQLITNAVATKADSAASTSASKPGVRKCVWRPQNSGYNVRKKEKKKLPVA